MSDIVSFAAATRVRRLGSETFESDVPDGWQQGRGAFGGLGIGLALRALEEVEPERPLRALTAEVPGPLMPGRATIRVTTLRRGSGVTTLEAHVVQDEGAVLLRVTGVFGGSRVQDRNAAPESPARGSWRDTPPVPEHLVPPPFAKHFEYRVTGPAPFSGAEEARCEGWVRPRAPLARWGAPEVVAMADAYWPAALAQESAPRPMATITFTLQLTERAHHLATDEPLYFRGRSLASDAGFVAELRELWTADGALVALNPQTMVIIR